MDLLSYSYKSLLDKTNPDFSNLTIGSLINKIIPYLFFGAGIALLLFIILGGLGLMTSGGDPKKVQAAQSKITSALIGFLIIFSAYWIVQLVYKLLGVQPIFKVF